MTNWNASLRYPPVFSSEEDTYTYTDKSTFAKATNFLKDVVTKARVYLPGQQNANRTMVKEFDEKIIQLQNENPNSDLVGFTADEVMDIFGIKAIDPKAIPLQYPYSNGISKLYKIVKTDNWEKLVRAINKDDRPRTAKFILKSLNNCPSGLTAAFSATPPICKNKLYLVNDVYSLINTTPLGASVGGSRRRKNRSNRRSKRTRRR